MASIHEHKNINTNASPLGRDIRRSTPVRRIGRRLGRAREDVCIRTVSHLPGGIECTNCYLTNKVPCDDCLSLGYETKRNMMSWDDIKNTVDPDVITSVCGNTMPASYIEFCELYEMYHDMPALMCDDESSSEEDDGYDSVS